MKFEIAELLELVRGNRGFAHGISVHKKRDDDGELMGAMRELEQLGYVQVVHEDEFRVDFAPTSKGTAEP